MSVLHQALPRPLTPAPSILSPKIIDEMQLEIFDRVPSGHITFAVTDGSCLPMVEPGQVLVIADRPRSYPQEGQWYLIQWIREARHQWERPTVQQTVGIPREVKDGIWGYRPPCNYDRGVHYCGDFGFSWEMMTDSIRGPVRGIYLPRTAGEGRPS